MKENDFLEEQNITPEEATFDAISSAVESAAEADFAEEPAAEDTFDAISSAVESAAEADFSEEEEGDAFDAISSAVESAAEADLAEETADEGDSFDAIASAVESAAEAETTGGVYPPEDEEEAYHGSGVTAEESPAEAEEEAPAEEITAAEKSASTIADEIPKHDRPAHKGRPRRKKGVGLLGIPHLIAALIWLLIIVAIGVSLGRVIWVCAADVLAFGRESKEVTITVTAEDTIEDIAQKLHENELIRYPDLFLLYADLSNVVEEGKITTGTFTLNTIYDYMALVNAMAPHSGSRAVIEDVLIPEGYSCRQIFALLEEKGICKVAELEEYAANGEFADYWFLEGVERGDKYCLEGFLFPDTYDFYENSTPREALGKMLSGFDYRFTEELYSQLPALNERISKMMRENGETEDYIAAHQLDLRGLLTIASLIEEETANNSESFTIASVIYNRLYSWGDTPRYLNIDAALFYALGEHKEALTAEDLQIDSPYNTYRNTGLVPGPITNPGLASIKAALDFEDTSYYYYVLDPMAGSHIFSKTYEDHEAAIAKIREGSSDNE